MLRDKNILLISPESWDHIFVSKHHYAVHLALRGNRVYFLGPPGNKMSLESTGFENLFNVNYGGFPPWLRFYPQRIQRGIIAAVYKKLIALCQRNFDIVWSFDNSVFFDFSALPDSTLKICHTVDYNQDFQLRPAAATADFCFCSSESIRNKIVKYQPNVYKINHGYAVHKNIPLKETIRSSHRTTVLYAGNLSIPYIDWDLLTEAIDSNPEADFLFVGPIPVKSPEVKALTGKTNAFFIGRVPTHELAAYEQVADVLLVTYKERYQKDQATNPHKVMEYLGSGKVIVATHTAEYQNLSPLIVMSKKNCEWGKALRMVLNNLPYYNSEQLQNERKSFAMNNTYELQIDTIEQIISR